MEYLLTFDEQDVSEMVLRLAHKIRNPLATIKSSVQLVEHLTEPTGDIAQCLASAVTEVERINSILREMQLLVRLERGESTAFEVSELVAEVGADLRLAPGCVRLAGEEAMSVVTDRELLRVSLREVLRNAMQASPASEVPTVSWRARDGLAIIDVVDSGPGVPEKLRERILRPFFSSSLHGSGLGLTIVSKAVCLLGGDLLWENRATGGCRFSLQIPAEVTDATECRRPGRLTWPSA